jgi:hypothetical protein
MESDDSEALWDLLAGSLMLRPAAPPPSDHDHVNEEDLWALASYDGGRISEQERSNWQRALECSECYNRLARLRHLLTDPEKHGIPVLHVSVEELRRRAMREQLIREARIQITQEWLGAILAAAAAKSRTRVRGAVRTRGAKPSASLPPPGEAPLVIEIADLVVTVTAKRAPLAVDDRLDVFAADDFARTASEQRFDVLVRATPRTTTASTKGLIARLHRADKTTLDQPFEGKAEVSFLGLSLGSYELELLPSP